MDARHACCVALLLPLLSACKPEPPSPERPTVPQAAEEGGDTRLRDAMQAPLDKAHAAGEQADKALEAQRRAIEAQQ